MDINNINPINQNLLKNIKETNTKRVPENKDLRVQNKESVYGITGESRKYIELSNKIPEVREDLVEKLRESIKNASYQIDIDRIVNKMFE
ncbi:MAG: flagellar biosynthesis anti-sigma factor FlgM [Defluviitoga tunisiensis]|jgi:anti-sigma28 factor (negative regulator of flagellin synthesis)|uniref:Flagellar biosynthesis anti-sigma factor n=1 Tax=Defluviitoga tunisiensis TaxID=1006576 RepID=A0A0C7NKI6_DEFTU|nr:flagellar biosynthesis anti-sigma factor FlgM [Defluviitoga tunisiensis]CEP78406.1 flagellar biosynthesis anti-sigma factor [Defluviitoga tunisiensis]HOB55691.1 flagellar biosynthesis anti-sigma factor FlgM [Defluviitoga tunisiensis]HOK16879.1 flagellar biosynthesis anti-sigma factor FlgM [Defluviitoga tunisiensis]HOL86583.1 flagellar biosynthesis anti-sigma factor FlgM [Defluviitoga tunisiensis]HOP34613.1 flagellar biosynthesis anti-sigma factor FlgM [Defluviitoga tunisiensis]